MASSAWRSGLTIGVWFTIKSRLESLEPGTPAFVTVLISSAAARLRWRERSRCSQNTTVDSVLFRNFLSSKGSFYLIGSLSPTSSWARCGCRRYLDYQLCFIEAIDAAQEGPLPRRSMRGVCSRTHLYVFLYILICNSLQDFVSGAWPEKLRKGVGYSGTGGLNPAAISFAGRFGLT